MALAGWVGSNKYKLDIDSTKIDGDLTNFPVSIAMISGTGLNSFDATQIFTDLTPTDSGTSWDNRKKIAMATVSGSEEINLYVEIEKWDSVNNEAYLWTRVPSLVSGTTQTLYLYYDADHADNTSYVGDVGDTAAKNVWGNSFVGVYHYSEELYDGTASEIKDSTSNLNHGRRTGAGSSDPDSLIGRGLDISSGDGARAESNVSVTQHTAESSFKVPYSASGVKAMFRNTANEYMALFNSGAGSLLAIYVSSTWRYSTFDMSTLSNGWHDLSVVSDGSTYTSFYIDGVFKDSIAYAVPNGYYDFGSFNTQSWGDVDETRVSNVERSAAWVKATYYSNHNQFMTFSLESTTFSFEDPSPVHQSTVYGTSHTLQLKVTISGLFPTYKYDATFYDNSDDSQIGATITGTDSGQYVSTAMPTPVATSYSWYVSATSSGASDTSDTYSFDNKFLCAGYTEVNSVLTSGIPVRLYLRSTGELIDGTTSTGVSGTFAIETTHNDYHYAVAILPDDDETNALIFDWLIP